MAMNDSTTGFNAYSHTDLSEKMSSTNLTLAGNSENALFRITLYRL